MSESWLVWSLSFSGKPVGFACCLWATNKVGLDQILFGKKKVIHPNFYFEVSLKQSFKNSRNNSITSFVFIQWTETQYFMQMLF